MNWFCCLQIIIIFMFWERGDCNKKDIGPRAAELRREHRVMLLSSTEISNVSVIEAADIFVNMSMVLFCLQ